MPRFATVLAVACLPLGDSRNQIPKMRSTFALQLRSTMQQALLDEGDPRAMGGGEVFDRYLYANERERGFHEKFISDPGSVRAGWVNASDFENEPVPLSTRVKK